MEPPSMEDALGHDNGLPSPFGPDGLFDLAGIGMWLFDASGKTTYVSRALASRLGYTREEMLSLPLTAFARGKRLIDSVRNRPYLMQKIAEDYDTKLIHRNGAEVRVRISSKPAFDEAQVFLGTAWVLLDISSHPQMKQYPDGNRGEVDPVFTHDEWSRSLLANIQDGYYECDLAGKLIFCNDAFCRIHGIAREVIFNVDYRDYISPETARQIYQAFNRVYLTGEPLNSLELEFIGPDGTPRFVDESVSLIRNAQGQATGFRGIVRDITARRVSENAIRESEERFRTMANEAPAMMWLTGPDKLCTFVSQRWLDFIGSGMEAEMGTGWKDCVHPDDLTHCVEVYNSAHDTQQSFQMEHRVKRHDGVYRWILSTGAPRYASNGEFLGYIGSCFDITDRKGAEDLLRQSEERYRTILENIQDGYYECDLAGKVTFCNDAFRRIYGYGQSGCYSVDYGDYLTPEAAKRAYQAYRQVYLSGESIPSFEVEAINPDGTMRYLDESIELIRDARQVPVGFRGVVRDTTARRKTENQIRLLEERFRTIANSAPVMIWMSDADKSCSFFNQRWLDFTGRTLEQEIMDGWTENIHPDDVAQTLNVYDSSFNARLPFKMEFRLRRHDGAYRWILDEAVPRFMPDGEFMGFIGSSVDITERKAAEESLRQSEERHRTILENIHDGYYEVDLAGNLTFANDGLVKMFGLESKEQLLGANMLKFADDAHAQRLRETANQIYRTGQSVSSFVYEVRQSNGTRRDVDISLSLVKTGGGQPAGFRGILRDVTERKRTEKLIQKQVELLEMIASGAPLTETLEAVVGLAEEQSPRMVCSILLLDDANGTLHHGAALSLPAEYLRCIDGVAIGPRVGSCGTAAYTGKPVTVADIAQDPLWADFREYALRSGLRACCSIPVFSTTRQVLGTFAVYYRNVDSPTSEEIKLIGTLAHLASIAIERARAERKLQASEARFRSLIERSGEGISLIASDGRITYTSPVMKTILGYEVEEVVGKSVSDRIHPDHLSPLRQQLDSLAEQPGQSAVAAYRIKHKNGTWRWIESTFTNLLREPNVKAMVVNFRDITGRKLVEEKLRVSEESYRTLIAALDEGIVLQDENTRILAANDSAERILGLALDQMVGRTSFDSGWRSIREDGSPFPGDDHPVPVTLRTGKPQVNVVMGIHKPDETLRWISINAHPLFRENETTPYAAVASFSDITERKRTEDALRISEERFAKAFNASPQPMVIFEASERRIVNANEAMEHTFGWAAEEILGRTPEDLNIWVEPEQQHQVRVLLASNGFARDLEIKFRTKSGEIREFLYSAETINLENRPHILVVASDITDRLRAERALQESEEKYRLLFEHGFAGVLRATSGGRMLDCNDALARILGCESREEMLQSDGWDFYFDKSERQRGIDELRLCDSVRNVERLLRRKDGLPVWTLSNYTVHHRGDDGELVLDSVVLDITERKLIEQQLAQSSAEMRALSARLETIREEERTNIAREIHDNLGQALTGLKLEFSWLDKNLSRATDEHLRRKAIPKLKEIAKLLEETIQTVRHIATELRPGVLDTLGLSEAIDWQSREFARRSGIKGETKLCHQPQGLPTERATAFFRIFQEILTNIARHSHARKFFVEMAEAGPELILTVRDNGIGITPEQVRAPQSLGLIGMRERALIFGGSVLVDGQSGKGTTVTVKMPIGR